MKKVVVLANSYSMQLAHQLWLDGESQEHHVWGATRLPFAEFEVVYAPMFSDNRLSYWLDRIGVPKNIKLQFIFAFKYRKADVFYASTYSVARILGLLKRLSIFKPKLIALVHYPLRGKLFDRVAIHGLDQVVCLSQLAYDDVTRNFPKITSRCALLGWAADTNFYDAARKKYKQQSKASMKRLAIVAAGKDSRDFHTLVRGFEKSGEKFQLNVYCSSDSAPASNDARINIVIGGERSNPLSINDLVNIYIDADIIAIPLKPVHRVAGLTSLIDALALGKPVLCSRNIGLDIDIEAIGCGLWIEPEDPGSWTEAITYLSNNQSILGEMGARGRAYAEKALRMDDYGTRLTAVVYRALDKQASPSAMEFVPPRTGSTNEISS